MKDEALEPPGSAQLTAVDLPATRTGSLPSVPLSTGQVRKVTPFVLAGLFVWGMVRRSRRRG